MCENLNKLSCLFAIFLSQHSKIIIRIVVIHVFRSVLQGIPLSDLGQSSAITYESEYEEIPVALKVKGDCTYTHNEAYQTVSGRDNTTPPTEGIYDN